MLVKRQERRNYAEIRFAIQIRMWGLQGKCAIKRPIYLPITLLCSMRCDENAEKSTPPFFKERTEYVFENKERAKKTNRRIRVCC